MCCPDCDLVCIPSSGPVEAASEHTHPLDTFAAAALTGLLSSTQTAHAMGQTAKELGISPTGAAAAAAYEYAQAMLNARSAVLAQPSPDKGLGGQI